MFCRRVHITEDTLDRLDNRFEVEPGNGHLRDSYLAQHAIKTYLIIDPTVSTWFFSRQFYYYSINKLIFITFLEI